MNTNPFHKLYIGGFHKNYKNILANPIGFFTTQRWSVLSSGGRFALTCRLMNKERLL